LWSSRSSARRKRRLEKAEPSIVTNSRLNSQWENFAIGSNSLLARKHRWRWSRSCGPYPRPTRESQPASQRIRRCPDLDHLTKAWQVGGGLTCSVTFLKLEWRRAHYY